VGRQRPPVLVRGGTPLHAANVRRAFRSVIKNAEGVDAVERTPRELRHSFVSLLSDNGIPLEEISRLVGHSSTAVTEAVYRKQIRPVLRPGGGGDGPHLQRRPGAEVTQLVTHWTDKATFDDRRWPVTCGNAGRGDRI
jgi:Phage integrase family